MVGEPTCHFHVKMFELSHEQPFEWWILNDEWGRGSIG